MVAPGTNIYTQGYAIGAMDQLTGTSFSTAIVSGIAALVLEKNPTLTDEQVRDLIISNSKQVGGYDHNLYPSFPGYNNEMFFGRVDCGATLLDTEVSISEIEKIIPTLEFFHSGKSDINISIPLEINKDGIELSIYNVTGQLVKEQTIPKGAKSFSINIEALSHGMYVINALEIGSSEQLKSYKFIK